MALQAFSLKVPFILSTCQHVNTESATCHLKEQGEEARNCANHLRGESYIDNTLHFKMEDWEEEDWDERLQQGATTLNLWCK